MEQHVWNMLLQTCCSILGRTLDDYQPHSGGTL
ncbi:hypothetical protein HaLaN_14230, partial [Haematococcus lacustris]